MPAGSCSASSTRSRPRRYDRRLDSTLPTDRVEWDVRGGGRQEALQEHNGEERRCGSCCLEPWWDVEDRWSPDADAWFSYDSGWMGSESDGGGWMPTSALGTSR